MKNNKNEQNYLVNANTDVLKKSVVKMRYRTYREVDYVDPFHSEEYIDAYDSKENSTLYLNIEGESHIGSLRTTLYSREQQFASIPAFEYFSTQIKESLGQNVSILESSRFVIDPKFRAFKPYHLFNTLRAFMLANKIHRPDYVVTTVIPDHAPFYAKLLGLKPISEPTAMNGLKAVPCVLLATRGKDMMALADQHKR